MINDAFCRTIVTDIKYRMAFAAIREFSDAGSRVCGLHFGSPGKKPPAAHSRYLSDYRAAAEADADFIFEYAAAQSDAVIFPIASATVEMLSRADPESRGRLIVPSPDSLAAANDKYAVRVLAKELDIPVPEQYDPRGAAKKYPLVVKYRNGEALGITARDRYRIVRDDEEFERVYADFSGKAAGKQEPPLAQEYLAGDAVGVSALFDRDSKPVSVICHRRVREYPVSGGPSSCCVSVWDEELVSYAVRLLKALKWRGVAMVEFKNRKLLEINPRVWGSFPLVRAAKSSFARAYLLAALGEDLLACDKPDYRLGRKMSFFFSDLAAAGEYLRAGNKRQAFGAIRDAANPFVKDGVIELRDVPGSLAYIADMLGRIGGKQA